MAIVVEGFQRRSADIDPSTLKTAADWRDYAAVLLSEAQSCERQLADRSKWPEPGYLAWRTRCKLAMQAYMEGYRRAKEKVKELHDREHRAARDAIRAERLRRGNVETAAGVAWELRDRIYAWARDGKIVLDDGDMVLLDLARDFSRAAGGGDA